jgi:hypothetical protein
MGVLICNENLRCRFSKLSSEPKSKEGFTGQKDIVSIYYNFIFVFNVVFVFNCSIKDLTKVI